MADAAPPWCAALPRDVQLLVLTKARLSIDQRRGLGISPGRLRVPGWVSDRLLAIPKIEGFSLPEGGRNANVTLRAPGGGRKTYYRFYEDRPGYTQHVINHMTYDDLIDHWPHWCYYDAWTGALIYDSSRARHATRAV